MKKFLSVILAALILACPLCSFAAEAAQTLEWYFCMEEDIEYCDPWIYDYKGEIALGENEITFTEDEYYDYYTFNAENSGYYYVEFNNEGIDWFGFPEVIEDSYAYGEAERRFVSDTERKVIYKLDAGETFLGIDYNWLADAGESYSIKIEYLGNAITDVVLDEGALDNLIIDVDLFNYDYSYIYCDIEVVFSNEKTIELSDEAVELQIDGGEWSKGENNATISYWGFEKDVVVTACEITNIISDVEFVNLDEYKNVQSSYNNGYYEDIYGAELVFTLADGTKIETDSYETDTFEFNGREYYFYVYYIFNSSEDVDIIVTVDGITLKTYECNVTKATLAENAGYLFEDIGTNIKDAMYYIRLGFSELLRFYDASDFEDAVYEAQYYFECAGYCIEDIFYSISYFAEFYI